MPNQRPRLSLVVQVAGLLLVPGCDRPVTPATLSTLLEHYTWLSLRPALTSSFLPDGGLQDDPWQVALTTERSEGLCYSFEGEVLLDGEPLEQLWPAHYVWAGVPPRDTCLAPVWQMPAVLPDQALSTLTVRDETGEAFMTVQQIGAVRRPFLQAPENGALSYGGSFTVGWSIPQDPQVALDVRLETDAGTLFSSVERAMVRTGYDGGFETFQVPSDGGEPLEGILVLDGYPTAVIDCAPAQLKCSASVARGETRVPVTLQ